MLKENPGGSVRLSGDGWENILGAFKSKILLEIKMMPVRLRRVDIRL